MKPTTAHEPLDLSAVKRLAKQTFGDVPGIEGFGIGAVTLRIYVQSREVCDRLPASFHGVPVECVVTGTISAEGVRA